MSAIGVDVGGTTTRVGLVDDAGTVVAARRTPTPPGVTGAGLTTAVAEAIEHLCGSLRLGTTVPIVIALPGILDPRRERLVRSVNLPGLTDYPIADEVTKRTGSPASCFTDAEAATWGEYTARTPRPRRFAHLRLGTGVACGLVVDGELPDVTAGRTSHWDVLVVDTSERALPCPCGRHGCLETVASGAALARRAVEAGYSESLDDLAAAWRREEPAATEIINEARTALSRALRNLYERFELDAVCLGGGVLSHLPCVSDHLVPAPPSSDDTPPPSPITLVPSRLGDDAGLVGAALLARRRVESAPE